jgi:hypothetical protein
MHFSYNLSIFQMLSESFYGRGQTELVFCNAFGHAILAPEAKLSPRCLVGRVVVNDALL